MSGLPDLKLEDTENAVSVGDVKELIGEEQDLAKADANLLSMFFLESDCRNLLHVLKKLDGDISSTGNYTREDLDDMIDTALESEDDADSSYPAFMLDFIREYNEKKDEQAYFPDDALMLRYWKYVMTAKNDVVAEWAELNINISNILTALIARQQGWDMASYVKGEGDVPDMLLSSKSKDFDLGRELDYMAQLMQIVDCDNPVEKERGIDALKWIWLEDKTFFDSFAVETLYAYLCKAQMLERWRLLDPTIGRERFETIIENLRGEARVPDEFKI